MTVSIKKWWFGESYGNSGQGDPNGVDPSDPNYKSWFDEHLIGYGPGIPYNNTYWNEIASFELKSDNVDNIVSVIGDPVFKIIKGNTVYSDPETDFLNLFGIHIKILNFPSPPGQPYSTIYKIICDYEDIQKMKDLVDVGESLKFDLEFNYNELHEGQVESSGVFEGSATLKGLDSTPVISIDAGYIYDTDNATSITLDTNFAVITVSDDHDMSNVSVNIDLAHSAFQNPAIVDGKTFSDFFMMVQDQNDISKYYIRLKDVDALNELTELITGGEFAIVNFKVTANDGVNPVETAQRNFYIQGLYEPVTITFLDPEGANAGIGFDVAGSTSVIHEADLANINEILRFVITDGSGPIDKNEISSSIQFNGWSLWQGTDYTIEEVAGLTGTFAAVFTEAGRSKIANNLKFNDADAVSLYLGVSYDSPILGFERMNSHIIIKADKADYTLHDEYRNLSENEEQWLAEFPSGVLQDENGQINRDNSHVEIVTDLTHINITYTGLSGVPVTKVFDISGYVELTTDETQIKFVNYPDLVALLNSNSTGFGDIISSEHVEFNIEYKVAGAPADSDTAIFKITIWGNDAPKIVNVHSNNASEEIFPDYSLLTTNLAVVQFEVDDYNNPQAVYNADDFYVNIVNADGSPVPGMIPLGFGQTGSWFTIQPTGNGGYSVKFTSVGLQAVKNYVADGAENNFVFRITVKDQDHNSWSYVKEIPWKLIDPNNASPILNDDTGVADENVYEPVYCNVLANDQNIAGRILQLVEPASGVYTVTFGSYSTAISVSHITVENDRIKIDMPAVLAEIENDLHYELGDQDHPKFTIQYKVSGSNEVANLDITINGQGISSSNNTPPNILLNSTFVDTIYEESELAAGKILGAWNATDAENGADIEIVGNGMLSPEFGGLKFSDYFTIYNAVTESKISIALRPNLTEAQITTLKNALSAGETGEVKITVKVTDYNNTSITHDLVVKINGYEAGVNTPPSIVADSTFTNTIYEEYQLYPGKILGKWVAADAETTASFIVNGNSLSQEFNGLNFGDYFNTVQSGNKISLIIRDDLTNEQLEELKNTLLINEIGKIIVSVQAVDSEGVASTVQDLVIQVNGYSVSTPPEITWVNELANTFNEGDASFGLSTNFAEFDITDNDLSTLSVNLIDASFEDPDVFNEPNGGTHIFSDFFTLVTDVQNSKAYIRIKDQFSLDNLKALIEEGENGIINWKIQVQDTDNGPVTKTGSFVIEGEHDNLPPIITEDMSVPTTHMESDLVPGMVLGTWVTTDAETTAEFLIENVSLSVEFNGLNFNDYFLAVAADDKVSIIVKYDLTNEKLQILKNTLMDNETGKVAISVQAIDTDGGTTPVQNLVVHIIGENSVNTTTPPEITWVNELANFFDENSPSFGLSTNLAELDISDNDLSTVSVSLNMQETKLLDPQGTIFGTNYTFDSFFTLVDGGSGKVYIRIKDQVALDLLKEVLNQGESGAVHFQLVVSDAELNTVAKDGSFVITGHDPIMPDPAPYISDISSPVGSYDLLNNTVNLNEATLVANSAFLKFRINDDVDIDVSDINDGTGITFAFNGTNISLVQGAGTGQGDYYTTISYVGNDQTQELTYVLTAQGLSKITGATGLNNGVTASGAIVVSYTDGITPVTKTFNVNIAGYNETAPVLTNVTPLNLHFTELPGASSLDASDVLAKFTLVDYDNPNGVYNYTAADRDFDIKLKVSHSGAAYTDIIGQNPDWFTVTKQGSEYRVKLTESAISELKGLTGAGETASFQFEITARDQDNISLHSSPILSSSWQLEDDNVDLHLDFTEKFDTTETNLNSVGTNFVIGKFTVTDDTTLADGNFKISMTEDGNTFSLVETGTSNTNYFNVTRVGITDEYEIKLTTQGFQALKNHYVHSDNGSVKTFQVNVEATNSQNETADTSFEWNLEDDTSFGGWVTEINIDNEINLQTILSNSLLQTFNFANFQYDIPDSTVIPKINGYTPVAVINGTIDPGCIPNNGSFIFSNNTYDGDIADASFMLSRQGMEQIYTLMQNNAGDDHLELSVTLNLYTGTRENPTSADTYTFTFDIYENAAAIDQYGS